jgi:hypothetical protein
MRDDVGADNRDGASEEYRKRWPIWAMRPRRAPSPMSKRSKRVGRSSSASEQCCSMMDQEGLFKVGVKLKAIAVAP